VGEPDDQERARLSADVGFIAVLGLVIDEAGPDHITGSLEIGDRHLQPHGIVHGGVYCSIIETMASIAGSIWLGDRGHVVGMSNQTDFLRAASSGTVHAAGTPIHRGRSSQLWLVEVKDDGGRLLARGQVRLANLTPAA
jgi:1,4-dihydroxy-2-naphthoyl-CoA hydrolase